MESESDPDLLVRGTDPHQIVHNTGTGSEEMLFFCLDDVEDGDDEEDEDVEEEDEEDDEEEDGPGLADLYNNTNLNDEDDGDYNQQVRIEKNNFPNLYFLPVDQ
jgi:hypothetical protein